MAWVEATSAIELQKRSAQCEKLEALLIQRLVTTGHLGQIYHRTPGAKIRRAPGANIPQGGPRDSIARTFHCPLNRVPVGAVVPCHKSECIKSLLIRKIDQPRLRIGQLAVGCAGSSCSKRSLGFRSNNGNLASLLRILLRASVFAGPGRPQLQFLLRLPLIASPSPPYTSCLRHGTQKRIKKLEPAQKSVTLKVVPWTSHRFALADPCSHADQGSSFPSAASASFLSRCTSRSHRFALADQCSRLNFRVTPMAPHKQRMCFPPLQALFFFQIALLSATHLL